MCHGFAQLLTIMPGLMPVHNGRGNVSDLQLEQCLKIIRLSMSYDYQDQTKSIPIRHSCAMTFSSKRLIFARKAVY